jgi:Uncharacterized BCR, YaiI/YqxD family COG1671
MTDQLPAIIEHDALANPNDTYIVPALIADLGDQADWRNGDSADAADDWIAERVGVTDVCVTSDIPLASRCLKKRSARRLADRKALDGSEYRQCACRSRYSPASAGAGGEYPGASPAD